jgi:general secretion pathway protein L
VTLLAILLPPRPRAEGAFAVPSAWSWVASSDGLQAERHGQAALALLPRAERVVAVVDAADVAWHRITLPKVPAGRLRAALEGLLEEQWLEDASQLHLALEPGASAGQPCWVAVTHKPWLQAQLAALAGAGIEVERIAPAWCPSDVWSGHIDLPAATADAATPATPATPATADTPPDAVAGRLTLSGPDGVTVWPLAGGAARAALEEADRRGAPWTATPAAVALAERWLDRPVAVLTATEVALRAGQGTWDLRQFDLALPRRGSRSLVRLWQDFQGPAWRPVRIGLALLAAVQLVGLNAWAWQQERRIETLRRDQVTLLRTTHPQVRAVLDAPRQMQRETDRLRSAAGQTGEADLEAALAAAASAWPRDRATARGLRFETGRLTLSVDGWTPAHARAMGEALRASGWRAELRGDQLTMSRQAPGSPPTPRAAR